MSFSRRQSPALNGKLGLCIFSCAVDHLGGEARKHAQHCAAVMEGWPMAVEFRNKSWWTDRNRESTLAFERDRGASK